MTDWLMVIITAIYVVATIFICVYNGRSAKAANEQTKIAKAQIDEMIKQFNEENRPVITIRFEIIRSGLLCFVVENIGPKPAVDVRIEFNDAFVDNLEKFERNIRLREAMNSKLFLAKNQKIYILLGSQSSFKDISTVPADIQINYNNKFSRRFSERTVIDISQYAFMLSYNSELEDISHHLNEIKSEEKKYHDKQLKVISKKSPVSVLIHSADGSKKFEVYKTVCLNAGSTTVDIAEKNGISKEKALGILLELMYVDNFVQAVSFDDDFNAKWYRQ